MAESSLDDFFAKKDKSKKTKKKYSTPDDLAKILEDSGKGIEKKKKDKDKGSNSNISVISSLKLHEQDDNEWKDFEDEKEKDYSGLRIQSLNLKDKEEEMRELKMQEIGQDNKKEDSSGPWKLKNSSPVPEEKLTETEDSVLKKNEVNKESQKQAKNQSNTTQCYVPPHIRNEGFQSLAPIQMSAALRKPKSVAPEINNDKDFPSLGKCA